MTSSELPAAYGKIMGEAAACEKSGYTQGRRTFAGSSAIASS